MKVCTTASIDHEGIEIELAHVPSDEPTVVQPSPTTLVVGYLVHDGVCGNPMKENDAEGTLYTFGEGVITDDNSAPSYLGLTSFGSRGYDPEYDLEHDGIDERVAQYIHTKIKESPELTAWMVAKVLETEEDHNALVSEVIEAMQIQQDYRGDGWNSDEDDRALEQIGDGDVLPHATLATKAWHELYAEGEIGAYLAVPVRYQGNNHGPGTTTIHTTALENANAVWVPDELAIENIRSAALPKNAEIKWKGALSTDGSTLRAVVKINGETVAERMTWKEALNVVTGILGEPTHADLMAASEKYASSTLSNYANWCNGDCWGVVVETFSLEDEEYVRQEEDACWGFIGMEYAETEVKTWIDNAAEKLKEVA